MQRGFEEHRRSVRRAAARGTLAIVVMLVGLAIGAAPQTAALAQTASNCAPPGQQGYLQLFGMRADTVSKVLPNEIAIRPEVDAVDPANVLVGSSTI